MFGNAKNSEINSVAIYSRLTKNMSQIDWTKITNRANNFVRGVHEHITDIVFKHVIWRFRICNC